MKTLSLYFIPHLPDLNKSFTPRITFSFLITTFQNFGNKMKVFVSQSMLKSSINIHRESKVSLAV